jgi:hypothetical protein
MWSSKMEAKRDQRNLTRVAASEMCLAASWLRVACSKMRSAIILHRLGDCSSSCAKVEESLAIADIGMQKYQEAAKTLQSASSAASEFLRRRSHRLQQSLEVKQ